ncbi:Isoflavone reductase like P3 [Fusarium albosuccineum]|uniref:Isoflavone reductase like P3 n=1 Tax=Fusarium albosuccineum TaxID=1237068 RepID=A0A8H4L4G1_9HYPO|nr:Isoflavone reductase like P3 [Fusarium albosuccineum]
MLAAARAELASGQSDATNSASAKPHKKRVRNFTADDRAAHRIFEKKRRESFRERLNDLARELPALAGKNPSRLSKHDVLDESISRHKLMQATSIDLVESLKTILQERDELLAEVNSWRATAGIGDRQPTADMNLDELARLESKIRGSPSEVFSGEASSSPDADLAFRNQEPADGHRQDRQSHPACSPPTGPIITPQTASWNAFASNGVEDEIPNVSSTTAPPVDQVAPSDFLNDSNMETVGFIEPQHMPNEAGQVVIMPPKHPLNETSGNQQPQSQPESQIIGPAADGMLPYNFIPDASNLMSLPEWCQGPDFTISMTSAVDFETDPILQEYRF